MTKVDMDNDSQQPTNTAAEKEIGALEAFWSFFSSMRTAIVLLLLLAGASIVGTLIEDGTGGSIYGSTWFSLLLLLVGINLAVCSINRFRIAWRRTFEPDVDVTPERVSGMARSDKMTGSGSPAEAAERVIKALRSRSYRLVRRSGEDSVSIYAAKGRVSIWGPYLTHLSILVIFIGAIYGNLTGSEGYTNIVEGSRTAGYFPRDSKKKAPMGFEVGLRNFTIKYDKNHNPTGYKSDLQVYDGGKLVTSKLVDVNHPLTYKGLSFFQSSYGLVGIVMNVTSPKGGIARIPYNISTEDGEQGRAYVIADQPWKQFKLDGKNLTMFVHNLIPDYVGGKRINGSVLPLNPGVDVMMNDRFPEHKDLDAWTRLGWMTESTSAEYKGYKVEIEKIVGYTGLSVSRNPGLPAIYVGFALMVLGVFASFYVSHKVIRVSIAPDGNGVKAIVGATSRADASVFDKDFKRVRNALE